jgi:hypothetical protein
VWSLTNPAGLMPVSGGIGERLAAGGVSFHRALCQRSNERELRMIGDRLTLKLGVCVVMVAVTIGTGCAPSRSEPPGPVTVTPLPPRVETPAATDAPLPLVSGRFAYAPGEYRYEVVTESEITQAGDSSAAALMRMTAWVTLRLERVADDSLLAHMAIDSLWAERDALIPAPDSTTDTGFAAGLAFTALLDAHGKAPTESAQPRDTCVPGESLLAIARDLLVPVPDELLVGAAWADTSTMSLCRGGVPVTSGVVHSYHVLGSRRDADGMPLMRLARATAFSLGGTATTEHRQIIALTGRGESEAMLEMDLRAGVVRSATSAGSSEVVVTYGRTSTPFTQRVVRRVRLIGEGA